MEVKKTAEAKILTLPKHKKVVEIKDLTTIVKIPRNLEIRNELRKNPIEVRLCKSNINQQADKAAYILSQIIDRASLKKSESLELSQGYVKLNAKILQKSIRDYKVYMNWLENNKIIIIDKSYVKSEHSKGYRLHPCYQNTGIKDHVISDKNLVKKLRKGHIDEKTKTKYPKLFKDFCSVELLDFPEAIKDVRSSYMSNIAEKSSEEEILNDIKKRGKNSKYHNLTQEERAKSIKELANYKMDSWNNSITKIHEKQLYFRQDKTSNRLHTSIVSVKKELRHHFTIKGQKLVSCDIKNSQPYISLGFFKNPKKFKSTIQEYTKAYLGTKDEWVYHSINSILEKFGGGDFLDSTNHFIELVKNGKLYEFMAQGMTNTSIKKYSREEGKKKMFNVLFCPPSYKNVKGRKIMKKYFPEVLRFFSLLNYNYRSTKAHQKKNPYKMGYTGNNLARILQKIESELILDTVCKEIKEKHPEIPLITLHDGIATTNENSNPQKVKEIMETEMENMIGINGIVEIEWDKWDLTIS